MRRVLAGATLTAALFAASLSAQSGTSFAGHWTVVPDPNAAAAAGGRGGDRGGFGGGMFCRMECTIAQDASTLTVTRSVQGNDVKTVYKLDGSESTNTQSFGGQFTMTSKSKAAWDGAKLTITTSTDLNGTARESKMVLSMDASGNLTVATTAPGFQDPTPVTTTQTYKK